MYQTLRYFQAQIMQRLAHLYWQYYSPYQTIVDTYLQNFLREHKKWLIHDI
jgi:hypothetical protein